MTRDISMSLVKCRCQKCQQLKCQCGYIKARKPLAKQRYKGRIPDLPKNRAHK